MSGPTLLNDRAMPLQPRHGVAANLTTAVKNQTVAAELVVTTDDKQLYIADGAGNVTPIGGGSFTVATLPAAGVLGRRAVVSDATSPTFLGTLTGGGTVKCPVFDNGSAWVAG